MVCRVKKQLVAAFWPWYLETSFGKKNSSSAEMMRLLSLEGCKDRVPAPPLASSGVWGRRLPELGIIMCWPSSLFCCEIPKFTDLGVRHGLTQVQASKCVGGRHCPRNPLAVSESRDNLPI